MSGTGAHQKPELALAADLPLREALALYERVRPHIQYVKVGLSLFVEHGPEAVFPFLKSGAKIFLDLKLHDIPNTVQGAARRAGELGVSLLTVHASGGPAMVKAAKSGAAEGALAKGHVAPRVLAVTVLTSLSDETLAQLGFKRDAVGTAETLAQVALSAGADGLVCSAKEVSGLRAQVGPTAFICTPGIRPDSASRDDQARTETPAGAVRSGANLLVIGRPIYAAKDPVAAAKAIADEVSAA